MFNEGSNDVDFRVEGNGNANAFFVQGSDDFIGIGTGTPKKKLHILDTTSDGIIIIKAQSYRTQDQNKEDALNRLKEIIQSAMIIQKKRKATKPTKGSVKRRLVGKANRKELKQNRKKVQL